MKKILFLLSTVIASQLVFAAPYRYSQNIDKMTGKNRGAQCVAVSDDHKAILMFTQDRLKPTIGIIRKVIHVDTDNESYCRIKLGDADVERCTIKVFADGSFDTGYLDGINDLKTRLLLFSGLVKIEIPIYGDGSNIYEFTLISDTNAKLCAEPLSK